MFAANLSNHAQQVKDKIAQRKASAQDHDLRVIPLKRKFVCTQSTNILLKNILMFLSTHTSCLIPTAWLEHRQGPPIQKLLYSPTDVTVQERAQ